MLTIGDMVGLPQGSRALQGEGHRIGHITHVGQIDQIAPCSHLRQATSTSGGHQAWEQGPITGTKDRFGPQDHTRHPGFVAYQLLSEGFTLRVQRAKAARVGGILSRLMVITTGKHHSRRRDMDQARNPKTLTSFKNSCGTTHINGVEILPAPPRRRECTGMDDCILITTCCNHGSTIAEIAAQAEQPTLRHAAGSCTPKERQGMAILQQALCNVVTEKACTTGNEDAHRLYCSTCREVWRAKPSTKTFFPAAGSGRR